MGCNASKQTAVRGDEHRLLGDEDQESSRMNNDPLVIPAEAAVSNQSQKPPPPGPPGGPPRPPSGPPSGPPGGPPGGPPNGTPGGPPGPPGGPPSAKKNQPQTYNRAKDRVDAIPKSKTIDTRDIRVRYAYLSQRGFYPDDPFKPNQDSYCVHEAVSGYKKDGVLRMDSFFGVFDGHGKDGDGCAQYARSNLPIHLKKALDHAREKQDGQHDLNREQIQNALLRAHVETNKGLHKNPQVDDSLSGTTAISVYWHGRRNRITIANVGDSRAVIGSMINPANSTPNGVRQVGPPSTIKAFPLSRDQTPYRKDERARIRATGARILSLDQLEGLEPINDISEAEDDLELGEELDEGGDPPRVWAPNGDYPGTAFTRSIGDAMAEELGVFAEPEMLTKDLYPDDRILVLASDGVFEFLTNQSVIDICAKFGDPLEACRAVVAEAYELWLQYELRTDDITIICIFIDEVKYDASTRCRSVGGTSLASSHCPDLFGIDSRMAQADREKQLQELEDEESDESDFEDIEEVELPSTGFKPVRQNVSKEKSKEIAKLKAMSGPAVAQQPDDEEFDVSKYATPKTKEEKRSIADAIKASVMFRNINDEQRQMIFDCMESIKVKKGTWVIRQGDVGDRFYIIDEGFFEVRILPTGMADESGQGGNIIHVYEGSRAKHMHPAFGELALMYSAPRTASIVAQSDGHLWALHRAAFRQVLIQAQDHRKELKNSLGKIPYFKGMGADTINKIAALMDEVTFGRGENLTEQGHPGKLLFVMKTGSCYTVEMVPGETKRGTLKTGDFFGDELFTMENRRYSKTAVSLQTTTCWQLDMEVAKKTLGPLLKRQR